MSLIDFKIVFSTFLGIVIPPAIALLIALSYRSLSARAKKKQIEKAISQCFSAQTFS